MLSERERVAGIRVSVGAENQWSIGQRVEACVLLGLGLVSRCAGAQNQQLGWC